MPLLNATKISFAKEQVAITLGRGLFGSHLGVAFHSANEGAKVLHLAFHKQLRTDPFPSDNSCWVCCVVDLPPHASIQLVAMLRGLSKKRPHIGYGLNLFAGRGSIGPTGTYNAPKGSDGFTCATIIAEVFRVSALPLIDEASWKPDKKNLAWGNAVCCLLAVLHPDEPDHIQAVRKNNIGLRVRPEEVAAAAVIKFASRPVSFSVASTNATAAFNCLDATCPSQPINDRFAHCVDIYNKNKKCNCWNWRYLWDELVDIFRRYH
jgi:hypothetical protein